MESRTSADQRRLRELWRVLVFGLVSLILAVTWMGVILYAAVACLVIDFQDLSRSLFLILGSLLCFQTGCFYLLQRLNRKAVHSDKKWP